MASFEEAMQALRSGIHVVIQHKDAPAAAQGGDTLRVVVATWCITVAIEDHGANLAGVQQTDALTPEEADELAEEHAEDKRDPTTAPSRLR